MKKMATGEGVKLMKVSGTGEVFLADHAQEVHLLKLADDKITVEQRRTCSPSTPGIDWDIRKVEGASGVLAGGLFNLELAGTGCGRAALRRPADAAAAGRTTPTFADPQAAITWSSGVKTSVKTDVEPQDPDRARVRRDAPDGSSRATAGCWSSPPRARGRRRHGLRAAGSATCSAASACEIRGVEPRVELLWWEGCPSHGRALAELREAMRERRPGPERIEVREVDTERGRRADRVRRIADDPDRRPDIAASGRRTRGLTCRIYRLRDGRVSPTPDPADLRDALRGDEGSGDDARNFRSATQAPAFDLPDTEGDARTRRPTASRRRSSSPATTAPTRWPGTTASLDVGARLRGPRRALLRDQPQRRRALSARLLRGDAEARARRRRLAGCPTSTTRRQEVARAYGAQDHAGRVRDRRRREAALPRRPGRRLQRREQNAEWLRGALDAVLAGGDPDRRRPTRSAAASSGSS